MTVAEAFRTFVQALTGYAPVDNTVAEVIADGADKVAEITGADFADLAEITGEVAAFDEHLTALEGTAGEIGSNLAALDSAAIKYEDLAKTALVLNSSTPDSTKSFRISVSDTGTISAEEVVEPEE